MKKNIKNNCIILFLSTLILFSFASVSFAEDVNESIPTHEITMNITDIINLTSETTALDPIYKSKNTNIIACRENNGKIVSLDSGETEVQKISNNKIIEIWKITVNNQWGVPISDWGAKKVNNPITIKFNQILDENSFKNIPFYIIDTNQNSFTKSNGSIKLQDDKKSIVFRPVRAIGLGWSGEQYLFIIPNTISDINGNTINTPIRINLLHN